MFEFIRLVFAAFATYRLAALVSSEEGPYLSFLYQDPNQAGIFERLRQRAGAYDYVYEYDEKGNQQVKVRTNLGRGISCPLCVGAYVAFVLVALTFSSNKFLNFLMAWLGVWGIQTFLENLTSDDALKGAIEDVADNMGD